MQANLAWAFTESDPEHLHRTRAVVIVHNGQIIGEQYAAGFNKNIPLAGRSMTKSVVNAFVAVLVERGKLSLTGPINLSERKESTNGLKGITVNHLLQMSSGLEFNEDYSNPLEDVTTMLLREADTASFAASRKLIAEPGTKWSYSSGSTNILSKVIRTTLGDEDYLLFPRTALFQPLGMNSAVIEPDASGTFVGSSFMYATAREWARFGWCIYKMDNGMGSAYCQKDGFAIPPRPSRKPRIKITVLISG